MDVEAAFVHLVRNTGVVISVHSADWEIFADCPHKSGFLAICNPLNHMGCTAWYRLNSLNIA
jgi:hypothetical protein